MLYISLFIAGFILILTPGPVFMANITLIAEKGRMESVKLSSGALFGDAFWLFLTFLFLIEANRFPEWLFTSLALACGAYIIYLSYKIYAHAKDAIKNKIFENPIRDGLVIGFLNPKSYPVMVAIFSVPLIDYLDTLSWSNVTPLFIASLMGFIASYGFLIITAGFPVIKNFYKSHITKFSYGFAAIFFYFGTALIWEVFQ